MFYAKCPKISKTNKIKIIARMPPKITHSLTIFVEYGMMAHINYTAKQF